MKDAERRVAAREAEIRFRWNLTGGCRDALIEKSNLTHAHENMIIATSTQQLTVTR